MSQTIADFVDAAWNEHTTDPHRVAARLSDAKPLLEREPAQVGAFLQLAEHLLLGHLGDADALAPWLDFAEPLVAQHPDAAPSLARARLASRLLRGDALEPGAQPPVLQVRALGTAISGRAAGGDFEQARRLLDTATRIGREAGGDALKSLAAACNNAASQLLDGAREARADVLMMDLAQRARDHWGVAGTWMNAERADYLLARCAAAIGQGDRAVAHARSCVAICADHDADPFEHFFGHEALAWGLLAGGDREQAASELPTLQSLLARIDDDGDRAHAQACLDKLQTLVNPA